MKRSRNRTAAAELGLTIATILWGTSFAVVKDAVESVPAAHIIAARFGPAAILLALVFHGRLNKLTFSDWKAGAFVGLLNLASYELQTWGAKYTTAGKNAFLTSIYCVAVPFFYWIAKRQKPGLLSIVSAFLCALGAGVLSLRGNLTASPGDLLSLGSGFAFAAQIVAVGILTETRDPILLTITQCAATALFAAPVALFTEKTPRVLPARALLELTYLSVFVTMLAFLLQVVSQKYIRPDRASLIMSLESVFGALSGILFLGETASPRTILGSALIFSAILLPRIRLPLRPRGLPGS